MSTVRRLGIVPIMDIIGDENFSKYNVVADNKLVASFMSYAELQAFKKTLPDSPPTCLNRPKYSFWSPMINNKT